MTSQQKKRGKAILEADHWNQYAVVEYLSRSYVEDFPDDAIIWLRRGRTLTALCRYDEADTAFGAAFQGAIEEVKPYVWASKAESFVRRGQFEEAQHCYERANDLLPHKIWILIQLAHALWMRGDLELAETRFREAVTVDGEDQDHDEALFNLGGVLVALGKLEEAAQFYQEALTLSPDYEVAQFRLEDVERALELQRDSFGTAF